VVGQDSFSSGPKAAAHLNPFLVLNISHCGLRELPKPLGQLKTLKALVAMGNPWSSMNPDIISSWPEPNSLSKFYLEAAHDSITDVLFQSYHIRLTLPYFLYPSRSHITYPNSPSPIVLAYPPSHYLTFRTCLFYGMSR
jgi:hypothetical protein